MNLEKELQEIEKRLSALPEQRKAIEGRIEESGAKMGELGGKIGEMREERGAALASGAPDQISPKIRKMKEEIEGLEDLNSRLQKEMDHLDEIEPALIEQKNALRLQICQAKVLPLVEKFNSAGTDLVRLYQEINLVCQKFGFGSVDRGSVIATLSSELIIPAFSTPGNERKNIFDHHNFTLSAVDELKRRRNQNPQATYGPTLRS